MFHACVKTVESKFEVKPRKKRKPDKNKKKQSGKLILQMKLKQWGRDFDTYRNRKERRSKNKKSQEVYKKV